LLVLTEYRFYEIDPNLLRNNNGNPRRAKLTAAISGLLESFSMVSLIPLNVKDEDSVGNIVNIVDAAINYWDYAEVRERPEFEQNDDDEE
jgi:GPN-loop GTPase